MNRKSLSGDESYPSDQQSRSAPEIHHAPLPLIEVEGPAHIVCFANSAFCRLVQKTPVELLGKPFAEIVINGEKCLPLLDRVYQTGEYETHTESDAADTPAYWLYAMWPALDRDEQPVGVVIQLTRITHFRENIAAMNQALLLAGLEQHELREKAEQTNARLQTEIAERERVERALREAQAQLTAEAERLEQAVADRTAQLRTSVGELEAFSYSLVHDLRAPVRAIQSYTVLAMETSGLESGSSAIELLNRVVKAATRMDSLIQDVLSLNQVILQTVELAPVDVETLVRSVIEERPELMAYVEEIKIESPLLRMLGHEASLSQCLSNLLGNATKFVKPGERPKIRVWTEKRQAAAATNAPTSDTIISSIPSTPAKVRLWIEDHGIGIDPNNHEKIFQIFLRLHSSKEYEGTGIGLAIVYKAVGRMGGLMGVESALGQGSRFWIELPAA